jgi:hypothetical protein
MVVLPVPPLLHSSSSLQITAGRKVIRGKAQIFSFRIVIQKPRAECLQMRLMWVIAAVLMAVLAVPSCTGAQGLSAPEMVFSTPGQELVSEITLDQAPGGISGYDITISLDPPGIANITRVEYPEWAVLTRTSLLPAETVRIVAVNMQGSAISVEGRVELARLYVVSSAKGTITPEIIDAEVDNNSGDVAISVTPSGTLPPVTVDEGGMGSISYSGSGVTGEAAIPTVTTRGTTLASSIVETTIATTASGTGTVTAEQSSENVIEAAPATPSTVPTTVPGPGPIAMAFAFLIAAILITGTRREN